jgi:hypothetical protein
MNPVELPVIISTAPTASRLTTGPSRDEAWVRTARRARALSWASLAWMTVEGVVGLIAGLDANALSVVVWAASSFVEGLASIIVIWRFTGNRTLSEHSERAAQRLVAGSFLLLVPFFVYEAIRRLIVGSDTMCAGQAAAALIALVGASAGLSEIDPIAALVVAAIAATESVALWRGEQDDCCAPVGFGDPADGDCCSTGDDCCG